MEENKINENENTVNASAASTVTEKATAAKTADAAETGKATATKAADAAETGKATATETVSANINNSAVNDNGDETDKIIGSDRPDFVERKRWLFLGLPFSFTKYSIREEVLTINRGFFRTIEDDCYMYKIVDVKLETSLLERMARLGTVVCYTSDTSDRVIRLEHIKNARAIKNYILSYSEKMRMKRRTLNTMSLNSTVDDADLTDADV